MHRLRRQYAFIEGSPNGRRINFGIVRGVRLWIFMQDTEQRIEIVPRLIDVEYGNCSAWLNKLSQPWTAQRIGINEFLPCEEP